MKSDLESRLRVLLFLFVAAFSILGTRLFYLQVIQGDNLRMIAEQNRTQVVFERAPRGLILDRNGAVLADNKPTFVVLFTPLDLKKEVLSGIITRLSSILEIGQDELRKKLQPAILHSSIVRVMDRASRHIAFTLAEQKVNLPGVSVVIEMQRRYPNAALAAHLLGYLGQVSVEEKEKGYKLNWLVGKMGIEKNFDSILRGQDGGMRLEVDASGRSVKILDRKEPQVGLEIKTTLDINVQKAAEEALTESKKSGAVVAVDPRSGEILAMASFPNFDPNAFGEAHREEFNRAIEGTYPPGSIFKIIDTAAGLETLKLDPAEISYCPGSFLLGGAAPKKFLCWKKEGHRNVNLKDALINSCNVYFYRAGLKIGPDPIENMARQFSLGSKTGVDLLGESSGLIPGRSMFKTEKRRWYDGDTLNMAIGQGTILFTPMQAALMASTVANRGKVFKPSLIREIRYPSGELYFRGKNNLIREFHLSSRTWDFIDEALIQVVEGGTGQMSKIEGIPVAGKTGTAQNPHGKDHAWFIAYAPVGNPTIAVSVLVEHGVHGASAAAPIARRVILASLRPDAAEQKKKSLAIIPEEFSGD